MKLGKCWYRYLVIPLFALSLAFMGCDDGDDGDQGPPGPPGPPGTQGTIIGQWEDSGHADVTAEAFNHWNEDGEVEAECARCHSKQGFLDYAEDEVTEGPAPIGSVISCAACHSSTLYDDFTVAEDGATVDSFGTGAGIKDGVVFPSGEEVSLDGPSNICMVCHQGRASTVDVYEAIANEDFGFINIHYYAAAATLFGTEVKGGFEYDNKSYVGQFTHVAQFDTCVDCHMGPSQINHTMEPEVEYCIECHTELETPSNAEEPFRDIRRTSVADYDGDGNTTEGMYYEINDTLVPALLNTIQDYAEGSIGTGIVYDGASYPYFFIDSNGNRQADPDEVSFGNRYTEFDAALLAAAYNYQVTQKEPCGYIHNALYILQLVYDSIEGLGGDVSAFTRPAEAGATGILGEWRSSGHGDVGAEAWEHWSIEEDNFEVPTSCAKCHSAEGFRDFASDGVVEAAVPVTMEPSEENTLTCGGCHVNDGPFATSQITTTLYEDPSYEALEPITFPAAEFAEQFGFTEDQFTKTFMSNSNMCMACHQGRESGLSVANAIQGSPPFSFVNRHYFAAAAILFGNEVWAGYHYDGRTYVGQNTYPGHGQQLSECVDCHMRGEDLSHTFSPLLTDCNGCHTDAGAPAPSAGGMLTSFEQLGLPFGADQVDYDGDGTGESFQHEIDGMSAGLLATMQDYAANVVGTPIIYGPGSYPYWFVDTNSNGVLDEGEDSFGNRYTQFDASLLTAAYNYHSGQDPCGDMHNYEYVLQTLYDSTDHLDNGVQDNSVQFAGNPAVALRPTGTAPPPTNGDGGDGGDGGETPTTPDTIVFENAAGNITFSHTGHVTDLGSCAACHTADPTELMVDNAGRSAAHAFCGECHQQVNTSCGFCHGN